MAIVTVHRSFGDDKFPLKSEKFHKSHNHVLITVNQLRLACSDMLYRVHVIEDSKGKEYGVFHKSNVNFL